MAKNKTLKPEDKAEMVEMLSEFLADGENGNEGTFTRMSKCERYAVGQQWDKEVLEANTRKRKFSLTINRIFPIINQLSGFDAKNPKDIKARNLRGGTQKGAEILSAMTKHTLDLNHSTRQQNQCFEDGIRCARGYLVADVDFTDDPTNGDITIRKYDPFMVIPDPACKSYDYNDLRNGAKYIILEDWEDKDYITNKYKDKAPDLSNDYAVTRRYGGPFSGLLNWMFGGKDSNQRTSYRTDEIDLSKSDVDFQAHKFRTQTYYWKTYEKGAILTKGTDTLAAITLTDPKEIRFARKLVEEQPEIGQLIEEDKNGNPVIVTVLHRAKMVGEVLLDYQKDPFNGMNLYPVVRFSPYFVNGYEFSVVENLIGPQDQVNWSWSMELNLIRKLANSGWKIVRDMTGTFADWLQAHGSEDGLVIDESKGGGKVEKLEPNQFPTNYDIITEKGSRHITEISQVRLEQPDEKQESGRAVLARQNWSLQNVSNLSSNWDYTQELLGEVVLGLIRTCKVYSEQEVLALVDENELLDPDTMQKAVDHVKQTLASKGIPEIQPPEKPDLMVLEGENAGYQKAVLYNYKKQTAIFNQYMAEVSKLAVPIARAMLIDEITSMKYGKYGIKVELAPHAETNRTRRMVEVYELNKALVESGQIPVSRNQLIEATDVPNKEEIKADIPQMPMKAGAA